MKNSVRILGFLFSAVLVSLCLATAASGGVTEKAIYTFTGGNTAATPLTKLVYHSGKLYGASTNGGARCSCGTVYELAPNGSGGWTYTTLYEFKGGANGLVPIGNLIFDATGNIYGVTGSGGSQNMGTVYELSPGAGGKWTYSYVYNFGGISGDGDGPDAGLIMDTAGNLYGTTASGGPGHSGIVFELALGSDGFWNETILYSFTGPDGYSPRAELIMDAKGNLYGTTFSGGTDSDGVVFELSPSAGGTWTESVLYSFTNEGPSLPAAPVLMDANGNLYGTTGLNKNGAVYELTPSAGGGWTETTLHTFGQEQSDGSGPVGGLTADPKGNLYGTTSIGGNSYAGTIYRLTPGVGGAWNYHLIYTFPSGSSGGNPSTPVTFGGAANFFGATIGGPDNGKTGAAVVYEIKP